MAKTGWMIPMSDPRNVAHDKKVSQEKKHHGVEASSEEGHAVQPGRKLAVEKKAEHEQPHHAEAAESPALAAQPSPEVIAIHEGSLAVLAQLKDMEFHSRANLERLGALMLTVEDELKQKAFVDPLGEIFSHQDAFQTKLTALIEAYGAECEKVPGAGA